MVNTMVTCDQCTLQMDADAFLRDGILAVQEEDPLRFSFRVRCPPNAFSQDMPNHFCTLECVLSWVEKKLRGHLTSPVHIAPGEDIFGMPEPAEEEGHES